MGLEVKTVWLVAGILSTSCGLLVMILRSRYTDHLGRAVHLWGGSCLCIGSAFLLSSSSQRAALSLVSLLIGSLAITLQYLAVTELKQQKRQLFWARVPVIATAAVYVWFGLIHPNITIGLLLTNVIRLAFFLRISASFAEREDGERQFVDLLAAAVYLALALATLALLAVLLWNHHFNGPYNFGTPRTGITVTAIAVAQAVLFALFLLAIAERLNEQLKHQAMHDPLTNLFNRRAIEEIGFHQKSLSLRSGQAFSVFMIDIDHFKQINDAHGHATGDSILKTVADRLTSGLRTEDYLGRWGGDEFCVLLPGATREEAVQVAERVMAIFSQMETAVGEKAISMGISMGIASSGESIGGFDALIALADTALYEAKRAGRSRYAFAPSAEILF